MDDATIRRAGDALIDAVAAPAKILYVGIPPDDPDSDHLFLVVVERIDGDDRFGEAARLDKILGRLLIPADVVPITSEEADRRHAPGSLLRWASTHGRLIAES